jgi:hypothetical protein
MLKADRCAPFTLCCGCCLKILGCNPFKQFFSIHRHVTRRGYPKPDAVGAYLYYRYLDGIAYDDFSINFAR